MLLPSDEAGMYIPFAFGAYDLFTELKFGRLSIIKIFKRNAQWMIGVFAFSASVSTTSHTTKAKRASHATKKTTK